MKQAQKDTVTSSPPGKVRKSKNQATDPSAADSGALTAKRYDKELKKLHVELVRLQRWVVAKGLKVCIVFEGRDGAGKGGHHQGVDRAGQSAHLSRRGPSCAD